MSAYPSKFKAADLARREIQLIHVARQKVGMDDETYRNLLKDRFNVDSSKDLDWKQRKSLLDHFKTLGFKVVSRHVKPKVSVAMQAQLDKIEALLADMKLPWEYLTAHKPGQSSMLKRLADVDQIAWANGSGLRAIIVALTKRQANPPKDNPLPNPLPQAGEGKKVKDVKP
jgi:hypothetical protein